MSLFAFTAESRQKQWLYGVSACSLVVVIGLGVFARNGWLPHTDPLSGKKTGWFGQDLPKNASSTWNPLAAPLPDPTPQLSKEYIYAGSRLLAVEDANANAAPPADLAVWRPTDGVWYVLGGPGSAQTFYQWGHTIPADKPAEGDYDGDGKTDFATYQPSTHDWWIVKSSDGSYYSQNWGANNDVLAQADYDGDGKTDVAVYRPSNGYWLIFQSSISQALIGTWGGNANDTPAPADYDGDGKADFAVWRSSDKTFYVYRSSDSQVQTATFNSAASGDKPVPGDYDGDGKANFALRHGADWIIADASGTPQTPITPSGDIATDIPVPNDYDGDGKVDIAVWRAVASSSPGDDVGHWRIRKSGSGNALRDELWGITGDIPVPAFYRR